MAWSKKILGKPVHATNKTYAARTRVGERLYYAKNFLFFVGGP